MPCFHAFRIGLGPVKQLESSQLQRGAKPGAGAVPGQPERVDAQRADHRGAAPRAAQQLPLRRARSRCGQTPYLSSCIPYMRVCEQSPELQTAGRQECQGHAAGQQWIALPLSANPSGSAPWLLLLPPRLHLPGGCDLEAFLVGIPMVRGHWNRDAAAEPGLSTVLGVKAYGVCCPAQWTTTGCRGWLRRRSSSATASASPSRCPSSARCGCKGSLLLAMLQ